MNKCSQCGRSFESAAGLNIHIAAMHENPPYPNKGRPKKKGYISRKKKKAREQWRRASKRYYWKNRIKVLEKAKEKLKREKREREVVKK